MAKILLAAGLAVGGLGGPSQVRDVELRSLDTPLLPAVLPTTTTVDSSPNPAYVGDVVTVAARVRSILLRPGGQVTFSLGSTNLGTAELGANGLATIQTRVSAPSGMRRVMARYAGALAFSPSSASTELETLRVPTSTRLTVTVRPSRRWALAATVTPGIDRDQRLDGRVTFAHNGVSFGSAPLDGAGRAAIVVDTPAAGGGRVVARYNGSPSFAESTSSAAGPPPPAATSGRPPPPAATSGRPPPAATSERPPPAAEPGTHAGLAEQNSSERDGTRGQPSSIQPGAPPARTTASPSTRTTSTSPTTTRPIPAQPGRRAATAPPEDTHTVSASGHPTPPGGSPAVSRFVDSIPTPGDVVITPERVAVSGLLAGLVLLYLGLITTLFNQTLAQNYERIQRVLGRLRERRSWLPRRNRHQRVGRTRHPAEVVGYACVFAALMAFIEPGFGFNGDTAILVAGFSIAVLAVTLAAEAPRAREIRTRVKLVAIVRLRVIALPVAMLCVGVSRLVGFLPGITYGMVAEYMTDDLRAKIGDRRLGQLSAISACGVLGLSLIAWLLWAPVHAAVERGNSATTWLVLDTALVSIFLFGLQGLAFELLPIRPFDGSRLLSWSRPAWVALEGLAVFGLILVVFSPQADEVRLMNGGVLGLAILLGVFGVVSVSFWAWFRLRPSDVDQDLDAYGASTCQAERRS